MNLWFIYLYPNCFRDYILIVCWNLAISVTEKLAIQRPKPAHFGRKQMEKVPEQTLSDKKVS